MIIIIFFYDNNPGDLIYIFVYLIMIIFYYHRSLLVCLALALLRSYLSATNHEHLLLSIFDIFAARFA